MKLGLRIADAAVDDVLVLAQARSRKECSEQLTGDYSTARACLPLLRYIRITG